ncbi:MAG TPA: aspartate kinase [Symbiobacteriaceae bacterium]|nr:aspartate kinase [Symbiobacteriaceae bacterium]
MRIIVQKFGGTSVATPEGRDLVVQRVERAVREGFATVVVVSAMGRQGAPYATDTLIQLANAACPELAPREMDLLLSCGEIISSVVVAGTLKARGLPVIVMTGGQAGIITDDHFGAAHILKVDPAAMLRRLREGQVVVVAGFQGRSQTGELTTLGRGGSDTTAAAVGGALKAEVVEIYTDVDGVKTADPRLVPDARTLTVTTYDEIAQMAHYGAKVVHPRAVEIAMQARVPLRIKSTFQDGPGTLITYSMEAAGTSWSELHSDSPVTGVTHVSGLAQISIAAPDGATGLQSAFRTLADSGISVDLINVGPGTASFCIEERKQHHAQLLLTDIGLAPTVRNGCAKVSVVGSGMRGRPGVMATVVEGLTRAGVAILQTADSHVTISCLVEGPQLQTAVQALHDAFDLGTPA